MPLNGSQAIIPIARGMYAKRIKASEYEELSRKTSVREVSDILKSHTYFKKSLATLSTTDPHREQLEELLEMDVYYKYNILERYDPGYAKYFQIQTEVTEILKAIQLLSVGSVGNYINHLPAFLVEHSTIDLLKMADATSFEEILQVLKRTPYYKVLKGCYKKDPSLDRFPEIEAVMRKYEYATIFDLTKKNLRPQEAKTVNKLFLQQAEIYNLDVLFRLRMFFPNLYPGNQAKKLVLPYTYFLTRKNFDEMLNANNVRELTDLYNKFDLEKHYGKRSDTKHIDVTKDDALYYQAKRILHLTSSPLAAMVAFLCIAKIESENVIMLIEGVRYKMNPEDIQSLLSH